ncbi:MAG: hypothetical protein DMG70_15285 [Acidobacteria bacterium]|nr:MAG: hypothetical protein DMG70_15285 [Acidobacteriota bacterium]PYY07894.1 MAG: hypothetical protein DMG69_17315 [Acidobacteriota bacterium]
MSVFYFHCCPIFRGRVIREICTESVFLDRPCPFYYYGGCRWIVVTTPDQEQQEQWPRLHRRYHLQLLRCDESQHLL